MSIESKLQIMLNKYICLILFTLISCNPKSSPEDNLIRPREPSRIEVYIDREMGISCFLSVHSNDGINCLKKVLNNTQFKERPINNLERYVDEVNKVVCYQSVHSDSGISCLEFGK